MMWMHAGFIFLEVFIYGKVFSAVFEFGCLWVAYYCTQTLSVYAIYGYLLLLIFYLLFGIAGVFMFLFSLTIIPYVIQHALIAYFGHKLYYLLQNFNVGK
jgi:hypothetical protein